MNISLSQNSISKALTIVSKAASTKPTMPILANTLLSAQDGVLKLYSTDLEIGIKVILNAEVNEKGDDISVNSKLLTEYINSLAESEIKLITEGTNLIVSNDSAKADFTTIKGKDFPKIPDISSQTPAIEIDGKELSNAIHKTVFAVSTDNSRPVLTGVLFDCHDNKLSLVAVDGYRLSKKEVKVSKLSFDSKFIVPSKVLNELSRIIGDGNNIVKIFVIKIEDKISQLVFAYDNIEINSRVIDGEYPDYRAIIPKEHTLSFKVDRSMLSSILKTSDTFARNIIGNKTTFIVDADEKTLKLKVLDPERGVLETKLDIFEVEGQNMQTAFNGRFLTEMISSMSETNEIIFRSKAPGLPSEFINPSDDTYTHIIMPMRVE